MDSNEQNKVIAFDTLFSTNHISMLKVMLPYMENQMQKSMAVYIKFLELNYTIDFYRKHPHPICGCMDKEGPPDLLRLCTELLPYCTEEEKKQMDQIRGDFPEHGNVPGNVKDNGSDERCHAGYGKLFSVLRGRAPCGQYRSGGRGFLLSLRIRHTRSYDNADESVDA